MRVLVTGAASGIGRATCLRLAKDAQARGARASVAAVDLGPSPGLDAVTAELEGLGAVALPLPGDVGPGEADRSRPCNELNCTGPKSHNSHRSTQRPSRSSRT